MKIKTSKITQLAKANQAVLWGSEQQYVNIYLAEPALDKRNDPIFTKYWHTSSTQGNE